MPGQKKRIAIFASGSGSNAQKIFEHFKHSSTGEVALVLSNNPEALVLQRALNYEIPSLVFSRKDFFETDNVLRLLQAHRINWVVLAGFLWKVPQNILNAYAGHIINIHPALLPAYGGKGMYGDKVHAAVLAAGEAESGITIHYVNENFDEGEHIYQAAFNIEPGDTVDTIHFKCQQLEHQHYPRIIEALLKKKA